MFELPACGVVSGLGDRQPHVLPRWPRKEAWGRHRLGGPAPSPHMAPSRAGGCGLALLSPGTGSPPDSNTQALQGPPHPTPGGPAPGSTAPLPRTALPTLSPRRHPPQCRRQTPHCPSSRLLRAHSVHPWGGLRTRLKECTERSPGLCRPRAESEGPTSFRGRWTRAPGRGCWERRPRRGSRGGGAERGWEACEAAPSGTQPGPLEGTPAALTDERLQALARGRVPDPTAKRHRTHTVRTRCSQQHTPRLAFPPPRPPPL